MAIDRTPEPPEGEVVYRRVDRGAQTAPARSSEQRFDPTLSPLLTGFALLLILVAVLGQLSVQRMEDTSRTAFDLELQYAARSRLMWQLRVALTQLDNEARDRMEAKSRKE